MLRRIKRWYAYHIKQEKPLLTNKEISALMADNVKLRMDLMMLKIKVATENAADAADGLSKSIFNMYKNTSQVVVGEEGQEIVELNKKPVVH